MAAPPKVVFSHITKSPRVRGGAACIDDTGIRVIDVVQAHSEGHSPEEVRGLFAVGLTLAQVYSALAYADENREEIEVLYADHARAFAEGRGARDEFLKSP